MEILEHVPLAPKTTMRIGGTARYFAEPASRKEVEEAAAFAEEKRVPLVLLGGGSNTVFSGGEVLAVVLRLRNEKTAIDGNRVTADAGKNLATLIDELAEKGLDLSPLTGIPGTVGGAIVGNAGQGPKGIWTDSFVDSVSAFVNGKWKEYSREECAFTYRESRFKSMCPSPVIWEAALMVPTGDPTAIKAEVERLLQKRMATQPHRKTAGSCFKAAGETPAWKLIDAAGLRGKKIGGVQIAEKHANFLLNDGTGTFADVVAIIEKVRGAVAEPLEVEMRLIREDGTVRK